MSPDDPRHGTYAGAVAHWLAGETTCSACQPAATRYSKRRRLNALHGITGLVPIHGSRLRLRALVAAGHSYAAIGRDMGSHRGHVRDWACDTETTRVTRDVADRIAATYQRLHMVIPDPQTRQEKRAATLARNIARRNGWLPPLALDDDRLDDPTYRPTVYLTKAERAELAAAGDLAS